MSATIHAFDYRSSHLNEPATSLQLVRRITVVQVFCPKEERVLLSGLIENALKKAGRNVGLEIVEGKRLVLFHNLHRVEPNEKTRLVNHIERGYKAYSIVEFLERIQGYTEISLLDHDYFINRADFGLLHKRRHMYPKRVLDFLYAILLLLVSLPISLITVLLIKLESKGPVFFLQERVGIFNSRFRVIKFRSMARDAEKNGPKWALKNDMRVTRIGKFIRKARIDELPQLLNVLKGEMSLIGPRPERKVFIDMLRAEIPFYEFRHCVKPGLTGLAQVKYPYGASVEDGKWKHKYDIYYIKNQSFWLDIKIIIQTMRTVIFGLGR